MMIPLKLLSMLVLLYSAFVSAHAQEFEWVTFNPDNHNQNILSISKQIESMAFQRNSDVWIFIGIEPDWSDELANAVAVGADMEVGILPQSAGKNNRWLLIYNHDLKKDLKVFKPVENTNIETQWYPFWVQPLPLKVGMDTHFNLTRVIKWSR